MALTRAPRAAGRARRRCAATAAVWLLALAAPAAAQTPPRLTMQGPAENAATAPIRDSLGRNCLDVEAGARAQIVNKAMVDHVVSLKNNCLKPLKLKVCYFNTDNCSDVDVPANRRVDTILGSMRGTSFFRYTIKQK